MLVRRWSVVLLLASAALAWPSPAVLTAQPSRAPTFIRQEPLPAGQRITAADGDTVVIEGDARVRIIRRQLAFVRIVANAEQRFVIILAENLRDYGDFPARLSDKSYAFNGLQDAWPLASRWEGTAWLEEYFPASSPGWLGAMLGIETPGGKVVFGNVGSDFPTADDARTTVVRFQGMSGGGGRQPFDQEEAQVLALATRNAASAAQWPSASGAMNGFTASPGAYGPSPAGGANGVSWFGMGSGGIGVTSETLISEIGSPPPMDPAQAPVGGVPMSSTALGAARARANGAAPRKIHDVAPVMPEAAQAARISGVVILEVTIGVDGAVADARVLRSIPQLDQAALDAVRQWRYEPMLLNGQPIPVTVAVTVPFVLPPQ